MISKRYDYSCASCGGPVEKLAHCHSVKDKDGNVTDYAGLGGWRCIKCGTSIKVKREIRRAMR